MRYMPMFKLIKSAAAQSVRFQSLVRLATDNFFTATYFCVSPYFNAKRNNFYIFFLQLDRGWKRKFHFILSIESDRRIALKTKQKQLIRRHKLFELWTRTSNSIYFNFSIQLLVVEHTSQIKYRKTLLERFVLTTARSGPRWTTTPKM